MSEIDGWRVIVNDAFKIALVQWKLISCRFFWILMIFEPNAIQSDFDCIQTCQWRLHWVYRQQSRTDGAFTSTPSSWQFNRIESTVKHFGNFQPWSERMEKKSLNHRSSNTNWRKQNSLPCDILIIVFASLSLLSSISNHLNYSKRCRRSIESLATVATE